MSCHVDGALPTNGGNRNVDIPVDLQQFWMCVLRLALLNQVRTDV